MTAVDFAGFVDDLATISGTAILPFFRTTLAAADKSRGGVFDPVTEADRAGEAAMRQMIKRTFPSHGIIGEEYGDERTESEFVWVLDPIDGTKSFIAGLPTWGTLIGLTRHGQPCYGMMHQPFTRERFFGDGGSAHWRGPAGERTLRTRRCDALGDAILSTTSPRLFEAADLGCFERVEAEARLTRFGYDCYAYCMLAAGLIDIVIETGLKPYDIVALAPIVQGAGGVVTTWSGGSPAEGGSIVASGDPRLHEKTLALLNR
ncbi:histidinol-phosphatase [Alsobacter sp. SYSU BS001988]|jgi:histidinol phosphatase-like enzyme (inositol monophosphatase family)